MGYSSSKKTSNVNTTNTSTVTDNSQNANLDGVEGDAIISGGDVNIQATDYGAISGALATVDKGLDRTLDFADSIGSRAIDSVGEANERSLDFGETALTDSLMFGGNALDQSLAFGSKALDAVRETSSGNTRELANAIDKVSAASRTDSANSLDKITKYGAYAIGVIALAVAAAFIFKGK